MFSNKKVLPTSEYLIRERSIHDAYGGTRAIGFSGTNCATWLQSLDEYCDTAHSKVVPLVVCGESGNNVLNIPHNFIIGIAGTGKTALLASWARRRRGRKAQVSGMVQIDCTLLTHLFDNRMSF